MQKENQTKEEMIRKTAEILAMMFYEDVEFVHGFVEKLYKKKGGRA